MKSEDLKLVEMDPTAFTAMAQMKQEWVIDPPPFLKLTAEMQINIYRIKVAGLAEIAKLESQKLAVEANVLSQVAEMLG